MIPRILVIGDCPITRLGIADLITRCDAGVVACQTGSLDELLEFQFVKSGDVIVADFYMPVPGLSNGLTLMQKIRTNFPAVPLVAMTSTDSPISHHEVLSLGVKALISKSDPVKEILEAIRDVLAGINYLSTSVIRSIVQGGSPQDLKQPRQVSLG